MPRVINVDKSSAYPPAVAELKAGGTLPETKLLRQVKYLNNVVEQDHRSIKRLTRRMLGFQSFHTAYRTLRGVEMMSMIRKGQIRGVAKSEIAAQNAFVNEPFGITAE